MLGRTNGVLQGFVGTQTTSPSLTINLSAGWIYNLAAVDSLVYGSLPSDSDMVMQQGYLPASQQVFTAGGMIAGQGQFVLVQVAFEQVDSIRPTDPNGGILPYINVADPSVPFSGPNNSDQPQNTLRAGVAVISTKYGTPATSGSQVPPSADAGNLPLYLINLTAGQTTISTGQIQIAGPAAYSGYPSAPIFPGVTGFVPGSSGSHHGGIAGQANKIVLTNGLEVQGIAAFPNLPVSNSVPVTVGGIITVAGDIPIFAQSNGNPNGVVAGNVNDQIFDAVLRVWYVCTTSGNAAGAIWTSVGSGGVSQYTNITPFNAVSAGNFTYQLDTASGAIAVNLPLASAMGGTGVTLTNIGSNLVTVTPGSGERIGSNGVNVPVTILPGNSITLSSRVGYGWYFSGPQNRLFPIAKSAAFSVNLSSDPSGSLYQVTTAATIAATLPASPADGTELSFTLTPSSTGVLNILPNGSDTIIVGGSINNNTTNILNIPTWRNGVLLLVAIPGGWLAC